MNDDQNNKANPLPRILECYVLHCMGELPEDHAAALEAMPPKFAETFNQTGPWHESLAKAMAFPPNMPAMIQEAWDKSRQIAADKNHSLDPEAFARTFVDMNFVAEDQDQSSGESA